MHASPLTPIHPLPASADTAHGTAPTSCVRKGAMRALPIFALALGWLPCGVAQAQSFAFTNPDGGWNIEPNQPVDIGWSTSCGASDVSLYLIDYTDPFGTGQVLAPPIAQTIPNTGSVPGWPFPATRPDGTSTCGGVFGLYIEDSAATGNYAHSDLFPSYIPFTPPAPVGGTVFAAGDTITIQWTGGCPDWPVNIALIDNTQGTVVASVATGVSNTGSHEWQLPPNLPCGDQYSFYIEDGSVSPSAWTVPMAWTYGAEFEIECECFPPPDGMVAWWSMDEQDGDPWLVDIAPAPSSTVENNALPMPSGVVGSSIAGRVDGAQHFGGLYGEAHHEAEIDFDNTSFSLDAWVRLVQCYPHFISPIMDKHAPAVSSQGYSFYIQDSLLWLDMNGSTFSSTVPLTSATDWYHVAVTVDIAAGVGTFFVDGQPAGTFEPPTGSVVNDLPLLIGATRQTDDQVCEIAIDELELFDVPLSTADVLGVYAAGSAGKCKPGAICVQKFNDLDGDGTWDSGEPQLAGWDFEVLGAGGALAGTITTGSDGNACLWFASAPYLVTEVSQPYWTSTTPNPIAVDLVSGDEEDLVFGNIFEQSGAFCDLQITKVFSEESVEVGQLVKFDIDVRNVGTGDCWDESGTTVTDSPPYGLEITGLAALIPYESPFGAGSWMLTGLAGGNFTAFSSNPLPQGYHIQFPIYARGTAVTMAENCAQVTNGTDSDTSNNHDCDTIEVKECGCQVGGGRAPWSSCLLWMGALLAPLARRAPSAKPR